MNTYAIRWTHLPIKAFFRIPGYDDLFQKLDQYTAVDEGCGFLTKPTRFARKREKISFDPMTYVNPV